MATKVSVIVPVYNSELYLEQCVTSILKQTYKDFELILIDDGSIDSSGQICDFFRDEDERVIVFHQKNGGQNAAIRTGMSIATGEYVFFVDSDDYVSENALEILYGYVERYCCDVIIAELSRYQNGTITHLSSISIEKGLYNRERMINDIFPTLIYADNQWHSCLPGSRCGKLFRKSILSVAAMDHNSSNGEDWLVTMCSIIRANIIYVLPGERIYYYRDNDDSVTHQIHKDLFEIRMSNVEAFCKINNDFNYDFYRQIRLMKFNIALSSIKSIQRYCLQMRLNEHCSMVRRIVWDNRIEVDCDYVPHAKVDKFIISLIRHKMVKTICLYQRIRAYMNKQKR